MGVVERGCRWVEVVGGSGVGRGVVGRGCRWVGFVDEGGLTGSGARLINLHRHLVLSLALSLVVCCSSPRVCGTVVRVVIVVVWVVVVGLMSVVLLGGCRW